MSRTDGVIKALTLVVINGVGVFFFAGCEEDTPGTTRPEVAYIDQTFSLLVCDGNGNAPGGWDHDGAAVCTLDWNGDGNGPNRVPVIYTYDGVPVVDGVAGKSGAGGDYGLWERAPWTEIPTGPIIGDGSGVRNVQIKALYSCEGTPRVWFLFRWEDPSHTMQPVAANDGGPAGGTMQYYWYQEPGAGFENNRQWQSHEDWLALVWSTWFLRNTDNAGKADKNEHEPADLGTGHWRFVETVPGFQKNGVGACAGSGDVVYKTPAVYTNDPNSPYYDKYYRGPYCDLWFFSATRSNYGGEAWDGSAWLFDCHFGEAGFGKPAVGSNGNAASLDENLVFDAGTPGYKANGGVAGYPEYYEGGPEDNPPGPLYLWEPTARAFVPSTWNEGSEGRIPGYVHRSPYGSAADIIGRCQWQQPDREYYPPWEGDNGENLKENEYGEDWYYTLEVSRAIGSYSQIDPEEDVLLGIYNEDN